MPHTVIVGGSDAGISAALRARTLDPDAEITLIVADAFPNFSVCGIPFFISREVADWRSLAHRGTGDLEAAGLCLVLETSATALDVCGKRLTLKNGGTERTVAFDRALIATGAVPVAPPIDGVAQTGIFFMRTMGDCLAFDRYLQEHSCARAVIIGGGYIGLEMADALTRRGLAVTLLEFRPAILQTVEPSFGAQLEDELAGHGVTVRTRTKVAAIRSDAGTLVVADDRGGEHRGDVVLVATGARPNVALAQAAGLPLAEAGAIAVDRGMRTPHPDIYAAGDSTCSLQRSSRR